MTFSRVSIPAPLYMNKLCSPRQAVPNNGAFSNSALGVKPGCSGEVIKAMTSSQPMWLQTIVEGGPLPRLGILGYEF